MTSQSVVMQLVGPFEAVCSYCADFYFLLIMFHLLFFNAEHNI